jgi:hypothetical protein
MGEAAKSRLTAALPTSDPAPCESRRRPIADIAAVSAATLDGAEITDMAGRAAGPPRSRMTRCGRECASQQSITGHHAAYLNATGEPYAAPLNYGDICRRAVR